MPLEECDFSKKLTAARIFHTPAVLDGMMFSFPTTIGPG